MNGVTVMKRFAALLLSLVLVMSLAACGAKTETAEKHERFHGDLRLHLERVAPLSDRR